MSGARKKYARLTAVSSRLRRLAGAADRWQTGHRERVHIRTRLRLAPYEVAAQASHRPRGSRSR